MKNSHTLKIVACAMVLSAAITAGAFTNFGTTTLNTNSTAAQSAHNGSVSIEQAKEIALNHANKTADQVQFVKSKQDWEHGRSVYEIEFIYQEGSNYMEYDYEIDASTGQILSYDYDIENYQQYKQIIDQANVNISEEAAKNIALERVPGASYSNIYKFKLEFDDTRWEYEGKIIYDSYEYEFEIDANTGNILKWEVESIHY